MSGVGSDYLAAHRRVKKLRGRASAHLCCSCGRPALDWALQVFSELRDEKGFYSNDPDDYAPMCRSCHRKHDVAEQEHVGAAAREGGKRLASTLQNVDPDQLFTWRSEAGKRGIVAAAPKLTEHRKRINRESNTLRRKCSCGKESTRAGIGRHQQVTGHEGWVDA